MYPRTVLNPPIPPPNASLCSHVKERHLAPLGAARWFTKCQSQGQLPCRLTIIPLTPGGRSTLRLSGLPTFWAVKFFPSSFLDYCGSSLNFVCNFGCFNFGIQELVGAAPPGGLFGAQVTVWCCPLREIFIFQGTLPFVGHPPGEFSIRELRPLYGAPLSQGDFHFTPPFVGRPSTRGIFILHATLPFVGRR